MKIISSSLEEFLKTSRKPALGSFYILEGAIYYSTIDNGLDHPKLWKEIVLNSGVFDSLVYENKQELIESPYGADRGRVTWSGKFTLDAPDFSDPGGFFILYGTPGCAPFEDKLKSTFGLKGLREGLKVKVDWKSDPHYKTVPSDVETVKDMLKLSKGKVQTTHIAQIVLDDIKDIVRRVKSRSL